MTLLDIRLLHRYTIRIFGYLPIASRPALSNKIGNRVAAIDPILLDIADRSIRVDRVQIEMWRVRLIIDPGSRPGIGRSDRMGWIDRVNRLGNLVDILGVSGAPE